MIHDPVDGRRRVLLVEDDELLREAMTRTLLRAGFLVVPVRDGDEAVSAGREARPDAAIIDVFLPDAGGLGVARALRRHLESVPILFVTGLSLPAVRDALHPTPVLFKPFTRRQLLASLREVTGVA